ncbi:ATP-binding protein [Velocimicrobium porci]|uniref:Circadian input-output histidine kinase CikA n=1 Tax=Velocimicrobium porci TaxID=2606634 RepID=A0A6L5Y090_9FIRM|nr:ATP-binding protein [Velocimicrobium porci]MSS64475.1 hypothetical protein [Velocimicrobium porci]
MNDILQEKKHQLLFEHTLEVILFFDEKGIICDCNQAAYKELGYDTIIGQVSIMDIFRRVFQKSRDGFRFLLKEEMNEVIETVAYRKNLTCYPVDLKISIQKDENFYLGFCSAVSIASKRAAMKDAKKAKVVVEKVNQVQNEFVANVTHELRTPVNGIMGLTNNLLETSMEPSQMESLRIIDRCCQNMIKIINNLLDFSKLEAGKFTIEEKEFSFRKFMDKAVEANLPAINEKGLKLIVSVSPDIPDNLIGDELRLTQILNNLLSNAVKFTNAGNIVIDVIKTYQENEDIELFFVIIDTGIGISEEEKDKLFKSFSQVDASITRRFGGTGLGLSIVKELVELMNGSVNVESEKGKGSTFSFTVRLKLKKEQQNQNMQSGSFVYKGLEKMSVDSSKYLFPIDSYHETDKIHQFGTEENKEVIQGAMEKLIICIEMDNWEKAEHFAGVVKSMISEEQKELRRSAFRLELTVRKEQHEKALEQYNALKEVLEPYLKNKE